jgi:hypothetical protein
MRSESFCWEMRFENSDFVPVCFNFSWA